MNTLLEKITSRGFWRVVIRPTKFIEKRIPDIASLYPILQKTFVSLRGWDFPHLDLRNAPTIDIDWVGQEFEWEHHISIWRFFQSGQFVSLTNMPTDWRDQSSFWPADEHWKAGNLLGVGDTLFCFTEIFEFAARLSLTDAGDEQMHIGITVGNLKGRVLYVDKPQRLPFFDYLYRASIDSFPYSRDLPKSDLIARPRAIALDTASELFKRFGWNTTIDLLRDWQGEMIR